MSRPAGQRFPAPSGGVLLKIAADVAAGAGDAPAALQAVEKVAAGFDRPRLPSDCHSCIMNRAEAPWQRSRNKWRELPAGDATICRKLEAYATGKPDSCFSNVALGGR